MTVRQVTFVTAFFIFVMGYTPAAIADTRSTDLAFMTIGPGLEGLLYYEFVETDSVYSSAITGSFVTSSAAVLRWKQLGLLARGNLVPAALGGWERWFSNGDVIQKNDLSYRLNRAVGGVGVVLPGGLEPYFGFWYAQGTQKRKDFRPASPQLANLVSIEKIRSQGIVLGLQGVFYKDQGRSLLHFYGDLIMIPGFKPFQAVTTNTAVPGVKLHSGGLGVEAGGAYGWTFGQGQTKLLASLQSNVIILYYTGQVRRDVPGYVFVEWPSNLTLGWSLMIQLGGGWFSILE